MTIVKDALGAAQALLIVCASSADALGVMERLRVDVLVVDIGDSGEHRDFIGAARAFSRDEGGDTPALALSRGAADRDALLAAGFQAHLARPVDVSELGRTLLALARR